MTPNLPIETATSALQLRSIPAPVAPKGGDPAAIRKAATDFEAMFLTEMIRPMFDGLKTDGLMGGGHAEEIYRSVMLEHYGKAIARAGGIGLADSVYRAMIQMQEAKEAKAS